MAYRGHESREDHDGLSVARSGRAAALVLCGLHKPLENRWACLHTITITEDAMKIFTVAGLIAGIAIVAYVTHRAVKGTARQSTASSDERYNIEELLADQEI
jgi:hypothetical protein